MKKHRRIILVVVSIFLVAGISFTQGGVVNGAISVYRFFDDIVDSFETGDDYEFNNELSIKTDVLYSYNSEEGSLQNFIPQGLCFTENYVLISMYYPDAQQPSVLVVLDIETHEILAVISLSNSTSHVGGLAYDNNDGIWISGNDMSMMKISLKVIDEAIKKGNTDFYSLEQSKIETYSINNTASAFTYSSGIFYVCTFDTKEESPIYSYKFNNDELIQVGEVIYVEEKAQGIVFLSDDKFVISQSYGRRNNSALLLYTKNSENTFELTKEFILPPLSEGIDIFGNQLYVLFESGAEYYSDARDIQDSIMSIDLSQFE